MFIGAHEAEYMFVTTLLKIEQHLLAQGRCPYKLFSHQSEAGRDRLQALAIRLTHPTRRHENAII